METGSIIYENGDCEFILYSPLAKQAILKLYTPHYIEYKMIKNDDGYFKITIGDIKPGVTYKFHTDLTGDITDPVSKALDGGVHGRSVVVDYKSLLKNPRIDSHVSLNEYIIYELHTGIFSNNGDFEGIKQKIPYLKELGITAVEIMPVAQYPGERNWGYDGVYPFAVHSIYGGVFKLRELIDALHSSGIAVILDVVYNHLGPEGNYLWAHNVYFTDKYKTPWGGAINFDDEYSDGVRNYCIENALFWYTYLDIDCLRLDAVHSIIDSSPSHIVRDISLAAQQLSIDSGKQFYLIAESDLNDPHVLQDCGMNCNAQWCDDFHHSLHTLLTNEQYGFYKDFGSLRDLSDAYSNGYVYDGKYSKNRKKIFGSGSAELNSKNFIVFLQNHDMTGNRAIGDRISTLTDHQSLKLAASAVLLSPFIPLIFNGEEYGETNPFFYFVDHSDKSLIEMVREGRKKEFSEFMALYEIPDPDAKIIFQKSKLSFDVQSEKNKEILALYKQLIAIRKKIGLTTRLPLDKISSFTHNNNILSIRYEINTIFYYLILNFSSIDENYIKPFTADFTTLFTTSLFELSHNNVNLLSARSATLIQLH